MSLDLDSLHRGTSPSDDLIDEFFTGRMWDGGIPGAQVLIGRIQSEAQSSQGQTPVTKRNLYVVRTTQGRVIPDCILLSPQSYGTFTKNQFSRDAVPGQYAKPYPGAFCIVLTADGGSAFICGFFNPASTAATNNDENTGATKPGMVEDVDARSPGDWIVRTEKALINVKRMGAITIESGATIRQTMNPLDGRHFTQSKYRTDVVEGYRMERGRVDKTQPEALSVEEYFDKILQRGRTSTRICIRNGRVDDDTRHEFTISEVNYAVPTDPIVTTKARARYFDSGEWVTEGPKFQWGGTSADEPIVLGKALVTVIKKLTSIIRSLKVSTAWGPSGVPLPPTPLDLTSLEQGLDDVLSDYMFSTKKPVTP